MEDVDGKHGPIEYVLASSWICFYFTTDHRPLGQSMEDDGPEQMLNLVLHHQKQRIRYYISTMAKAVKANQAGSDVREASIPSRSTTNECAGTATNTIQSPQQTDCQPLEWVDNYGYKYSVSDIRGHLDTQATTYATPNWSDASNLRQLVDDIFHVAQKLAMVNSDSMIDENLDDVVLLMKSTLCLWKFRHGKTELAHRVHRFFRNNKARAKLFQHSILFLCRIYYAVEICVEAARMLPNLQLILFIPVPYHRQEGEAPGDVETVSSQVVTHSLERLNIPTAGIPARYLNQLCTKLYAIRAERKQTHVIHAEIQALYHMHAVFPNDSEDYIVHKYVGCSRRCCFLCNVLIRRTVPEMRLRGSHNAVLHRWEPHRFYPSSFRDKFENGIKDLIQSLTTVLRRIFTTDSYRQEPNQAQSSHGLPSTTAILDQERTKMVPSRLETTLVVHFVQGSRMFLIQQNYRRIMMHMQSAVDDEVSYAVAGQKPGRAIMMGGGYQLEEKSLTEAEQIRDNFVRGKDGFEPPTVMPQAEPYRPKSCTICKGKMALSRCSACRKSYCSRACQKRDWRWHVFKCRVRNRPNTIDALRWFIQKHGLKNNKSAFSPKMVQSLFADDELCYTFGFCLCWTEPSVRRLMMIYKLAMQAHRPRRLQFWLDEGSLHQHMHEQLATISPTGQSLEMKDAIAWYLDEATCRHFQQMPKLGCYLHQSVAVHLTKALFNLPEDHGEWAELPPKQAMVAHLYVKLVKLFDNIPNPLDQDWMYFGFCHCQNDQQRTALRQAYLDLGFKRAVTLSSIAEHSGSAALTEFMSENGVDMSDLIRQGIHPHPPAPEHVGVYRFISEVHHALSGTWCSCFQQNPPVNRCSCLRSEPQLSAESEYTYGFHGTVPWERWQLLNFYLAAFSVPSFCPQDLQAALDDQGNAALERYLDTLMPDFRRNLYRKYRTSLCFPGLGMRLLDRHTRLPIHIVDYSVCHDVSRPDGLCNAMYLPALDLGIEVTYND